MAIAIPTITSEGEPIDPAIAIVSFEVHKALDRITEARLVVRDGSAAKREFTFSDGEQFAPGKLINIKMRRGDEVDVQLFEGLVVRHRVEAASGRTVLQLELKDAAFKLTRQRKSAVHREQTDDEVMRTLIEGAGLKVGTLDATTGTQHELIQYYASDWDFLRARADINGLVVVVEDGTISARKMSEGDAAKLKLE